MPSNKKPTVTVIVTVLNEAQTIKQLLTAFSRQTIQPAEVIVADGGSTDRTQQIINDFANQHPSLKLQLIKKQGNRSVGRNAAISQAENDWIAITDAGCQPQQTWLAELIKKQQQTRAKVIAGYYRGQADSVFQQAVIPYTLVMPDKVDSETFLPATRSMLLDKKVWKKLGGFDERLSLNEDYAFARKIKSAGFKIAFARKAIVNWQPRSNLLSFAWMIFRFAKGDVQAGIWRPKVLLIFVRYILFLTFTALLIINLLPAVFWILWLVVVLSYLSWSVVKNHSYAPKSWRWLPTLQITSDLMVMAGSLVGLANPA